MSVGVSPLPKPWTKQAKRTATFFEFCSATSGVLLCTDVAARGLETHQMPLLLIKRQATCRIE